MSVQRSVAVIGGGVAGLSAAVFLTEKDFKVTLIEASPKLGGRAYSFFDKERNMFFDNGQHIFAGWYKNTFNYLKVIGSYDKLNFQKSLEVNFINSDKKVYKLKCPDISPPNNLIMGLLKFGAFNLKDKFALKNIRDLLKDDNFFEEKFVTVRELLKGIRQTENIIKYFWEPFILAVFNTRPENVSVKIFLNVLKTGFNEKTSSTLVIPDVNLNELLIDDALKYFEKNNVNVLLDKRVTSVSIKENVEKIILEDGSEIKTDLYLSAVPFFSFKKLFDERIYMENKFRAEFLKTSCIVSVHLFFNEKVPEEMIPDNSFGMTGLTGTIVQWIFKRSDIHLSLVISGADELQIADMKHEDIFEICLKDLDQTLSGFDRSKVSDYKVIKEKRATFIPDAATAEFRPHQKTGYDNLFLAGDWTDTGMPATIESAVTSAKICSELMTAH